METGANFSECKQYRYTLYRIWDASRPLLMFVMLNPSTADAHTDDPTIRRCLGFANRWNYGGPYVCNLFAYRSTNPDILKEVNDPVGPENDAWLRKIRLLCKDVVCAWGTHGQLFNRDIVAKQIISNSYCLDHTKQRHPKHPLYIKADTQLKVFQ